MVKVKKIIENGRDLLVRRQAGIFSAALIISFTYGVSMILGVLRERLLVSRFYACCREQLDVYYAAFRIPDMIFQLVVIGALSAAFIPVFLERLSKDEKDAYHLASSLINLLLSLFLLLAIFFFIFAKPFSYLITGNFVPWQVDLMVQMTRVMLLAQILFLVSNFFSAIAQSHQRFFLPALSPVVYNLGIIFSVLFLFPTIGIWSATIGVLLGAFFHLIIQVPLVIKLGFQYKPVLDIRHAGVRKVIKLMFPRAMALAASQIEATVSLFLATSLSSGSLTLYYLAQRLADLPVRLLGTSIGQAALPALSVCLAEKKTDQFKKMLSETLGQIFYLALPVTAIFLVLRVQLVRFAYGAKSFPWAATVVTGRTLAAIAFSIFSQSSTQLLVRGFYAIHDTITPFIISLISVFLNVVLSFIFIFLLKMEIFGLALAFSLASFVNFILLLLSFNFRKEKFLGRKNLYSWFKMGFSATISAFFTWASMRLLDTFVFETSKSIPLLILTIISGSIGILTYLFLSKLFKLEELLIILRLTKKLSEWKKALAPVKEVIGPRSETVAGG